MSSVQEWSVEDVQRWLEGSGFEAYTGQLCDKHRLDGNALLMLQEEDLRNEICLLGDRKRLLMSIHKLQSETPSSHNEFTLCDHRGDHIKLRKPIAPLVKRLDSECSVNSEQLEDFESRSGGREGMMAPNLKPEYTKLIMAYVYMFSVFLLTAFVMVIVHDRVPDMKKYPPLPDIVLDNMPYVPWAFEMCELTGLVLLTSWLIILCFHKHRFILLRRMFSMTGTVFLLRCVTMLITSLSVPGVHLQCQPKTPGDIWYQMSRAIQIWRGGGMSLQGVRTCGDYMFSGHTVVVTMLNFLITEYTPRKLYWVHTASWILNIFGVFFILAAHEHYSIDVFIAFYITSRLFLYYHSLANNRALTQQDRKRTRIWFPLFSYFESGCNGIVPNEFEWPLPWPASAKRYFERSNEKQRKKWN